MIFEETKSVTAAYIMLSIFPKTAHERAITTRSKISIMLPIEASGLFLRTRVAASSVPPVVAPARRTRPSPAPESTPQKSAARSVSPV